MENRQEQQSTRDDATASPSSWRDHLAAAPAEVAAVVPGLILCIAITGIAMAFASVSHHLQVLRDASLVQSRRDGQHIIYSLNTTVFQDALQHLF